MIYGVLFLSTFYLRRDAMGGRVRPPSQHSVSSVIMLLAALAVIAYAVIYLFIVLSGYAFCW